MIIPGWVMPHPAQAGDSTDRPVHSPRSVTPGRPLPISRKPAGKADSLAEYCGILCPA